MFKKYGKFILRSTLTTLAGLKVLDITRTLIEDYSPIDIDEELLDTLVPDIN